MNTHGEATVTMTLNKAQYWWRHNVATPSRRRLASDYLLIFAGAAIMAVAMHLFFIPNQLVAGGLSGAAQIVNSLTEWPIGTLVFIGNIPLFYLGWRFLGGHRFLARTIYAAFVYSLVVDGLEWLWPGVLLTTDLALNAVYGGVMAGVGAGLVFRGRATSGGTDILALLLERRFGIPLSQGYLFTDGAVVFLAALAFSWEHALYAVIGLYIGGVVTDFTLNGSSIMRTVTIITARPQAVADRVMNELQRGVTNWSATGMYTGQERPILLCVVSRAEMMRLKTIVRDVDPEAFIIIGHAQEVLGEGFRRLEDTVT